MVLLPMITVSEVLLIGGMAAVTFATRYTMIALLGRILIPDVLHRALRYVPVAVLTALILPALVMPQGDGLVLTWRSPHLVAGLLAILVAWRTRHLLLTIVVGMGSFWLWRWLVTLL
jgi:branched-subunit amino acid transport protein